MSKPLVSVVVCTFNRASLLADALRTLCEQTLSASEYEIIVVDNNSSDSTRNTVEEFMKKYRHVRYIFEENQGLSLARNRGWQNARGEYVAYMDDDARADTAWLEHATKVIHEIKPDVFGGPYYPFYLGEKPAWFKDSYASHVQGDASRPLTTNEYLDGMNVCFRRALLTELGGFDPDLGMKGSKVDYGEETALIIKARKANAQIYYCHEMKVLHLVPEYKMNPFWYLQAAYEHGRSADRMFMQDHQYREGELVYSLITDLNLLATEMKNCILDTSTGEGDFLENRVIERLVPVMGRLGVVSARYEGLLDRSGGTTEVLRHVNEREMFFKKRIAELEKSIEDILRSRTFRTGNAVTFPLRAVLSAWQKIRKKT